MNLNLDIINDHLPKTYRTRRYGPENRQLLYSRPLPYRSGDQMKPNHLYITLSTELPPSAPKRAAVICVGGRVSQNWLSSGAQILHITGLSDIIMVMHEIFAIYDKFDQWDSRLCEELLDYETFDIRQMLKLGAEILDNRIGIANDTLQTIFSCTLETVDGVSRVVLDDETSNIWTNLETTEALNSVCHVERKITSPYMTTIPKIEYKSYCNNIYVFNSFAGCLFINCENRPFRESDYPLADRLFDYLQKGYYRHLISSENTNVLSSEIMSSLFEKRSVIPKYRELLKRKDSEYWLCFKLKGKTDFHSLPKEYMCSAIRTFRVGKTFSMIYNEEITGLFLLDNNGPYCFDSLLGFLPELLRRTGFICGLSNGFSDVYSISEPLIQADYAIEIGMREAADKYVYCFGDFILQYILEECTGNLSAQSLFSKGLLTLIEHDRQKGSEYIKTLDVYLKSETNASRTADLLYIHRNSLIKRLDNIKKILGADFENPRARLYLRICLMLMECDAQDKS